MEEAVEIQVTVILEMKLLKYSLQQNLTIFTRYSVLLNNCQDGTMHTFAITSEQKQKTVLVNSQHKKQARDMQVTFMFQDKLKAKRESIKQENCIKVILILEIKLEKYIFMQNMTIFQPVQHPFSQLGWDSMPLSSVCHNIRTE